MDCELTSVVGEGGDEDESVDISMAMLQQLMESTKLNSGTGPPPAVAADGFDSFSSEDEQFENTPHDYASMSVMEQLLWAAETNDIDKLSELLSGDVEGLLLQCYDEDGYTPLHRAAYNGNIEAGGNVDARTDDGWTPLHSASRWNQGEAASILIENGARVNAQTNGGQTALHLAASHKFGCDVLQLLLSNRYTDKSVVNSCGATASQIAASNGPFAALFEAVDDNLTVTQVLGSMWESAEVYRE